jgi:monovalent cation/hydrogen antiporter
MDDVLRAVALVLVVGVVAAMARRLRISAPILLVLAGIGVSFVPHMPTYRLDPELVLVLFLPPLLYAAALQTSLPAFRANLRSIGLLSIGLVLFTAGVVGATAYVVVPDLPLAAAIAFGAIVAPPDAVAATAVARQLHLPRKIVTVLEGESLLNDATALVTYRVAVLATMTGAFSVTHAGVEFLRAALGGFAVGLAVALVVAAVRRRLDDPLLDNTLSLLTPFVAYVPAESWHFSGVIAVVTTGLYLGHRAPVLMSAQARLQSQAVWSVIEFLLQGVVFMLIGLQLPDLVDGLAGADVGAVAGAAAAVSVVVILTRMVWVFAATYLGKLLPGGGERPGKPWQYPAVISWAGMRGVVSLAAAFALPLEFPQRDLLLFLTFVVIAVTLLLQGLTLPAVIRRLRLPPPDPTQDALQEAAAQQAAATAAVARLEELIAQNGSPPFDVADRLRHQAEKRQLSAWERLGGASPTGETPSAAYRRLRVEMLRAEREVIIQYRDSGRLDDEVMRNILRDLDLEESMLLRE